MDLKVVVLIVFTCILSDEALVEVFSGEISGRLKIIGCSCSRLLLELL